MPPTRIVSRQNPRYREVARLVSSSRDRRKAGRCVLEGEHLVAVHLDRIGLPEAMVVNEDALARSGVASLVARVPESRVLVVPRTLELLSPLLMVLPVQLLAYHIALLRGCDVDQPGNLAKSVTVE